jgi:hypothetical protein
VDLGPATFYWRNQNCEKEKEKEKICDCLIWQGSQKMQFAYKNIDTESKISYSTLKKVFQDYIVALILCLFTDYLMTHKIPCIFG